MLHYNKKLKPNARKLRKNLTNAERLLWSKIRCKQILGVQFYRQKPIGNYIVDFYAPAAKLVIELDGGQHFSEENIQKDQQRDSYMTQLGLRVMRFDNLQVMQSFNDTLETIFRYLEGKVRK